LKKRQRKTKTNKQTRKKNNTHPLKKGGGATNVRLRITVFGTFAKYLSTELAKEILRTKIKQKMGEGPL